MFAMPGPVSMLLAVLWLAAGAYLAISLVNALVMAWLDTRAPSERAEAPVREVTRAAA